MQVIIENEQAYSRIREIKDYYTDRKNMNPREIMLELSEWFKKLPEIKVGYGGNHTWAAKNEKRFLIIFE